MNVTINEVVAMIRDRYGLSMADTLSLLRTPLHPATLRDQFAGQALAGVASNPESGCNKPSDLAHWAYQCADAMLKEREKHANVGIKN